MSPAEITASIVAVANILAQKLTRQELEYWGMILSQLGQSMGVLASLAKFQEKKTGAVESELAGVNTDETDSTVLSQKEGVG